MRALQNRLDRLEARRPSSDIANLSDDQLDEMIVRVAASEPDEVVDAVSAVMGWPSQQAHRWVVDVVAGRQ